MSTFWIMGEWNACSHNGILFGNKNEVMIHVITWMNIENITVSEIASHKRPPIVWFSFYEMSRRCISIEIE